MSYPTKKEFIDAVIKPHEARIEQVLRLKKSILAQEALVSNGWPDWLYGDTDELDYLTWSAIKGSAEEFWSEHKPGALRGDGYCTTCRAKAEAQFNDWIKNRLDEWNKDAIAWLKAKQKALSKVRDFVADMELVIASVEAFTAGETGE